MRLIIMGTMMLLSMASKVQAIDCRLGSIVATVAYTQLDCLGADECITRQDNYEHGQVYYRANGEMAAQFLDPGQE